MNERTTWQKVARRIRVPMGFVFAGVFLWLARPDWVSLGCSLPLVALGVWLRGYAAGYVKKNQELTMTGPYGFTRNPLYLGSMMIAFGFAGASRSWVILVALAVLFAVIYVPTIRSEEAFLRGQFPGFEEYARRVPRLVPRVQAMHRGGAAGETGGRFSRERYLHHREYNAAMGAVAIYVALIARMVFLRR